MDQYSSCTIQISLHCIMLPIIDYKLQAVMLKNTTRRFWLIPKGIPYKTNFLEEKNQRRSPKFDLLFFR